MPLEQIATNVYRIPIQMVNAYLIDGQALVLVDTGVPGSADAVLDAVRELGKQPQDVKHIVVTHLHADHSGSLAALKRATGAPAYMHPLDAALVRTGQASRPSTPGPTAQPWVYEMLKNSAANPPKVEPTEIEHELGGGDLLPFLNGACVIHTPGHAAGQVSLLLPQDGGVLVAGDAANNAAGLNYPPIFEDFEVGKQTLGKLAALEFEVACFGHGPAITSGAAAQFREKWGQEQAALR